MEDGVDCCRLGTTGITAMLCVGCGAARRAVAVAATFPIRCICICLMRGEMGRGRREWGTDWSLSLQLSSVTDFIQLNESALASPIPFAFFLQVSFFSNM